MEITHNTIHFSFITGLHSIVASDPYDYMNYSAVSDYSKCSNFNMCSSRYDNERELVAVVNMEIWNSFGSEIIFYKTTYDSNYDKIFGEDGNRFVVAEWNVMSYFTLPKENKVWDKFGIEGINDFSIYISKRHFECKTNYIPRVGDLILTKYNNKLYEINEVKEEAPLFMQSKQYAWELIVRKAKMEHEFIVSSSLSASPISKFYKTEDLFDIKTQIDVSKEDIIYTPISGELPKNDPFGNW